MSAERKYEMDVSVTYEQGLDVIEAALQDEGLILGPKGGSMDNVRSVISRGRKLFFVPESRIIDPAAGAAASERFKDVLP